MARKRDAPLGRGMVGATILSTLEAGTKGTGLETGRGATKTLVG